MEARTTGADRGDRQYFSPGRRLRCGSGEAARGRSGLPDWVRVVDFGIRGVHLAYEMLDGGYDTTILIDAAPRGEAPGTVYLIEPDLD